ncbi:MAG: efflux RND transporter periplasmic adaptor subunit [Gammaproteobacteria bacterium]|nr:efflux RND transporter periplasmic adaptor subunit [Gammaproteobacteria bacterium]MBT8150070.1 efflux RND transporter periplasmic adaptor subunit [Gammaproteobacteria bacterium]NNM12439.1 efflux RND transporter periplasmic adaptor subunit [Pseudomonadales bacterium]RZV49772.1 MAG: efflux RND transporter periplasmic adaptor subunit [Pseudomonadales bacterium]
MQRNFLTALAIAIAVSLWLLSGAFFGDGNESESRTIVVQNAEQAQNQPQPASVRVRIIDSQPRVRQLLLRGKTQSKRQVDVKTQVAGAVVARPVERGDFVKKGTLLCELATDDRNAAVVQAQAQLRQYEIEYEGTRKLQAKGLQSKTAIAAAEARLESARALLKREQINLQNTRVRAPFAGVVDKLHMHVGDYASVGTACVTLIDLDPMLVTANISESDVGFLPVGATVTGKTVAGRSLQGVVTFVASQSDPVTRTFPIEVTVANADRSLKSGQTARLSVKLDQVMAHLVSPALFTLNDNGEVGLRVVDDNNIVEFHPISLLEDTEQGVWVTGLPQRVRLITVGQESVLAGQNVAPVLQEASALGILSD